MTVFEGPLDNDEASDAIAEVEEREDVAAAMREALAEFLEDCQEYVEEGIGESALAISCLVAARISGIAPDEDAHHWLDRNPFGVDEGLRELAAAAFDLATRPEDNFVAENRGPESWREFLAHLEPYRKALHGERQDPPEPFVPDRSDPLRPWLLVYWSDDRGSLHRDGSDRLVRAVNGSDRWRAWWQPSGLQELRFFGHHGPCAERTSRGRMTAEVWIGVEQPRDPAADLRTGLSRVADHLRLGPLPGFPETRD